MSSVNRVTTFRPEDVDTSDVVPTRTCVEVSSPVSVVFTTSVSEGVSYFTVDGGHLLFQS